MSWDTILLDLQTDAVARLDNEPFFADIALLQQSKGVTDSDVETALGVFNEQTGTKPGACVIALMPSFAKNDSEAPGPELAGLLRFHVITLPLINNTSEGTQKSAEKIAANVLNLLHRYFSGLLRVVLIAEKNPIVPLETNNDGEVSYEVRVGCEFVLGRRSKVATPQVTFDGASFTSTISCATTGAVIYYTTDGSYPGPENANASVYDGTPIATAIGSILRAGAVLEYGNWIPSDTACSEIVAQVIGSGESGEALGSGTAGEVLGTGEGEQWE